MELNREGTSSSTVLKIDVGAYPHVQVFNDDPINYLSVGTTENDFGSVIPNEGIEFRDLNRPIIYIKSRVPGSDCPFRVKAWGDRKVIYASSKGQSDQNYNNADVPNNVRPVNSNEIYDGFLK